MSLKIKMHEEIDSSTDTNVEVATIHVDERASINPISVTEQASVQNISCESSPNIAKNITVSTGFSPDHAALIHLDYEHSGHTGFAGILYDTTANWNEAVDYVPPLNMIIVYTDYRRTVDSHGHSILIPCIKLGDGETLLKDLAFLGEDVRIDLLNHIENNTLHITQEERERWNNKLNVVDDIDAETLIFTRN